MDSNFWESLRGETDPLADEVVRRIMDNNELEVINRLFLNLERNSSGTEKLPAYFQEYLSKTSQLPAWIDTKKIRKAQELYQLHGLEISMVLLFKSLPQSYCCAKGAKVLQMTGRLSREQKSNNKYSRRIMETSQFVMNVLSENAFDKQGSAIITTQKIRLIHASIRFYIKKYGWDAEQLGEPINQQDMIGTLMSFSALIVEGLEMLNIKWTDFEKDSFIHSWNVAGYILGVREDLLPPNYKEAIKLGYQVFDDQKAPSPEGKELAGALVDFVHHIIPGTIFDHLAEEMIYFFLGPELSDLLGVKRDETFLKDNLPEMFKVIWGISDDIRDHSAVIRAITKPFSKMVLQGVLYSYNDAKGMAILIPPSLQENWQLNVGWKNLLSGPEVMGRRFAFQKKINVIY